MKKNKPQNKIIPQMFDVRPVDSKGDLDLGKIKKIALLAKVEIKKPELKKPEEENSRSFYDIKQSTPIDAERKRFRRAIQEEKKKVYPIKKTADIYYFEDDDVSGEIIIKNRNAERAAFVRKIEAQKYKIREAEIQEAKIREARNREIEARRAKIREAEIREAEARRAEILEAKMQEARDLEEMKKREEEHQKQLEQFQRALSWKKAVLEKRKQRREAFDKALEKNAEKAKVFVERVLYGIFSAIIAPFGFLFRIARKIFFAFQSLMFSAVTVIVFPFKLFFELCDKSLVFFRSIFFSVKNFESILMRDEGNKYSGEVYKTYRNKYSFSFFAVATAVFFLIFGAGFFYRSLKIKSLAIENGKIAYANLKEAKGGIENRDFGKAAFNFQEAYDRFEEIQNDVDSLGKIIVKSSKFFPYFSKLSSGSHLAGAGKNIAQIGKLVSDTALLLDEIRNPLETENNKSVSLLKVFQDSNQNIEKIAVESNELEENLNEIDLEDIPEEQQSQFVELKKKLPEINDFFADFAEEGKILTDVLGGNGPRKYLFLFQNNQEMRATGGFIGTYAVMDIFDGNIKNFFVDGIFNPDGQFKDKVVPPIPIQKISANWSLHDSNWFPDFPVSAEKAAWFYEKTGGPTVDGVITMTPNVMQKLLEITGPIEMPEYSLTINSDNFLESIQSEVEVNYDKKQNQPKKILADLAPKILERVFNAKNISDVAKTAEVILENLKEKHILIYSKNYAIEKMLSSNGWSGEILDTKKDYLSVINTNINGFKTDGVVSENIEHNAEIQTDGSIIDTVIITRHHNGGKTPYPWWNKVNANYMRVYVPKGSRLIRASGQTREFNPPPIDYKALDFKEDAQVKMEEDSMIVDSDSGTRIYEDSGKTVFANWTYVSPQETTVITYSYLLPFKISANSIDTYSLLAQKQSGSVGSEFSSKVTYPDSYKIIWQYPENSIDLKTDLKTDKFIGVAFEKKQ